MREPTEVEIETVAVILHWLKTNQPQSDWWVIDDERRDEYRQTAHQLINAINGVT
jgi:hypothetical protein